MKKEPRRRCSVLAAVVTAVFTKSAAVLLCLLAWEVAVRMQSKPILSAPSQCALEVVRLFVSGDLLADCVASIRRVLVGFLIASALGITLGFAVGIFPIVRKVLTPLLDTIRPIPPIAWIPISIVLFQLGDPSSYFVIFIGAFFPVLTNTMLGAREVPVVFLEAARSLGASGWQRFLHVIWPASLPNLFAGLRTGLGFAWMCVVAAEMMGARSGLGYMIQFNRQMLRLDRVVAGMLVIGVLGLLMTRLMQFLERLCLPWRFLASASLKSLDETGSKPVTPSDLKPPDEAAQTSHLPAPQPGSKVEIRNLTFGYFEDTPVIHDFSLTLKPREIVAIIGPSGCGKTT
ncbi:MAG: ABC transporter permease subunit, partial [Planctomycetota bacterium]|nr:ABC transporter permease subunit [Planctomycetota bacterium]